MPTLHQVLIHGELLQFVIEQDRVTFKGFGDQCETCAADLGVVAMPVQGMDDRFICTCGEIYVGEPVPDDDE